MLQFLIQSDLNLVPFLGPLDGHIGPLDYHLEPLVGRHEPLDDHLRPLNGHLGPLDGHLGPLDGHLGPFNRHLGPFNGPFGGDLALVPLGGPLYFGITIWGPLAAIWGLWIATFTITKKNISC